MRKQRIDFRSMVPGQAFHLAYPMAQAGTWLVISNTIVEGKDVFGKAWRRQRVGLLEPGGRFSEGMFPEQDVYLVGGGRA